MLLGELGEAGKELGLGVGGGGPGHTAPLVEQSSRLASGSFSQA
jgi:hypothetical protein